MEDDGFTLVTGRKAGKPANNPKKFRKTEKGTHIRVVGTEKDVEKTMEAAKIAISKSGLASWTTQKLEFLVGNRKIRKLFVIGNGHFDRIDEPGAHQLALFIEISRNFNSELVFQEPICSEAENTWLRTNKIEIRKEIDTEIDICDEELSLSLLGMIHGEHEILEGFLERNSRKLQNLIVIGNNYGGVDWELSKFKEENRRINGFFEKSVITLFPEVYEPHSSAFSSTVIMSPVVD